ncbi:MAG: FkbM family methyltransferase [Paraprevotella sp.]|nr:FkbM family methyltransferase [Paraprevotella sp.]
MKGKVLLDIGAAEAVFTLDTIDLIEHAYVFECDEAWLEALIAKLAPWAHKVTFVNKYVSDKDDKENVTLDTYFSGKSADHLFLKMDIEGYEQKALKGAERLLSQVPDISGSVCVYHTREAETEIRSFLEDHHFRTRLTPGYLYFENELRRGVIRFAR